MRKLAFCLFCIVILGGASLPPPYDIAAIPDAAAARQHALNICQSRASTFKTLLASVECGLAAHRLYATTEKLRDMASFNAYAAAARHTAADVDAGRISQADASRQSAAARAEYDAKIQKQYSGWQATQASTQQRPLFDRTVIPAAKAARDKAVLACGSWAAGELTPHAACILKAEKAFATSIGLQKMDFFYGYASVLRVDTVDAEDGRRAPNTLEGEHQRLWADFLKTLDPAYSAPQAK